MRIIRWCLATSISQVRVDDEVRPVGVSCLSLVHPVEPRDGAPLVLHEGELDVKDAARLASRSCNITMSWDTANTLELKIMVITSMMMAVKMTVRLILFFYLQFSNSSSGRRFSNSSSSLGET